MKHTTMATLPTTWRFMDDTDEKKSSALRSFATDDTLCQLAGSKGHVSLRAWVHDSTIVLGTQDSRLPFVHQGIDLLKGKGYRSVVRNSGGLAVLLDQGVLNLSLVFPGDKSWTIDGGYELMSGLIQKMFPLQTIEAREIVGSYCPGKYDLSIDGKKFAGISQRRVRGGIAVQIYLCVTGTGSDRAETVRQFYEEAVQTEETRFEYPQIRPEVMASLSELTAGALSVNDVVEKACTVLEKEGLALIPSAFTLEEEQLYSTQLERVTERHHRCLNR
ncbi:lipoate--protein ligase family protein [Shouchella shacheensis]|uniref:lipoate--protein ligase family protein n=1 Tax=Shouchella shacheensis TaxID=1649580 RepID=UPI00074024F7|nr:lipoate--protein ligase family protein [Shouchella shacheensis]